MVVVDAAEDAADEEVEHRDAVAESAFHGRGLGAGACPGFEGGAAEGAERAEGHGAIVRGGTWGDCDTGRVCIMPP